MKHFHAVMIDECGQEFGASVEAESRSDAAHKLQDMYPENRGCVQLESNKDARDREAAMMRRLEDEQDGIFQEDW